MPTQFQDRREAGQLLAAKLARYASRSDALVLALPRGGVPVAYEVAARLRVPLDVIIVRKLGAPEQEELALGAIASGGIRVLNPEIVESLGIPAPVIEQIVDRESRELQRREFVYRGSRPPLQVQSRTVILIDDGIATGATARAAVKALRQMEAQTIIVATPVAAMITIRDIRPDVDDFVAVLTPADLTGVGQWYRNFSQTTDAEVQALLRRPLEVRPRARPRKTCRTRNFAWRSDWKA